jgi:hypothetical protein
MSDEMNELDLPETRPSAREIPIWECDDNVDSRDSWTTERGVKPRPNIKRPIIYGNTRHELA